MYVQAIPSSLRLRSLTARSALPFVTDQALQKSAKFSALDAKLRHQSIVPGFQKEKASANLVLSHARSELGRELLSELSPHRQSLVRMSA